MKKSLMKNLTAEQLMLEHRNVRRWGVFWLALTIGLGLTFLAVLVLNPTLARPNPASPAAIGWWAGLLLSALLGFAIWFSTRRDFRRLAAELDAKWHTGNRLETVAELRGTGTNLERAQAGETEAFLSHKNPKRPSRVWRILPWTALALVLVHFVTGVVWFAPAFAKAEPPKPAPVEPEERPPRAEIVWQSPESEATAAPVEEVLTKAVAKSESGLKNVKLVISVNGEQKLSVPIEAAGLGKKGETQLNPSLYLDEAGVEPFDMVSYWIEGERIWKKPLPPIASKMQFVQIRRFRDDIEKAQGGEGSGEALQLLVRLKLAQLLNYKENFLLSKTDLPKDHPLMREENKRVAEDQALLHTKSGQIIDILTEKGFPAEGIHLLRLAEEQMKPAAELIAKTENAPALPLQGKSLGYITEIEKLMRKLMAEGKGQPQKPPPKDPFAKQKDLEMKDRMKQAAGMLEMLVKQQEKLASELNSGQPEPEPATAKAEKPPEPQNVEGEKDPEADWKGTQLERQTKVSQQVGVLVNAPQFSQPVLDALEKAHQEAISSMERLRQEDRGSAREPASLAAASLREAARLMNQQGQKEADEALAEEQRKIDQLDRELAEKGEQPGQSPSQAEADAAAKKIEDSQRKLAAEARKQLETGSAKAAERLGDLAKAFDRSKAAETVREAGKGNPDAAQSAAKKVTELADATARARLKTGGDSEQVREWVAKLEQNRATLKRMAEREGAGKAGEQKGAQGKVPGETSGKEPGDQKPGAGDGEKKPGEGAGDPKSVGQGKAEGQKPGEGEGKAPGDQPGQEGKGEGQKPGEGEGQAPGDQPGQQGKGEGQKPGEGEGKAPGDGKGQGEGQGQGSGNEPGEAPSQTAQGDQPGESNGLGAGSGSGEGSSSKASSASPSQPTSQNQQAPEGTGSGTSTSRMTEDIAGELTDITRLTGLVMPEMFEPGKPGDRLREQLKHRKGDGQVVVFFETIDAPLADFIALLDAKLDDLKRQHDLVAASPDEAPEAYRQAVAKYFELLSQDYDHPRDVERATP